MAKYGTVMYRVLFDFFAVAAKEGLCIDDVVVDHVVHLALESALLDRAYNGFGAVIDIGQGQDVLASQVQEDAKEVEADPSRHTRAAGAIDHTGTQYDQRNVVVALVLPDELLLAMLGMGVDIALFGMGLDGRVFIDHAAVGQLGHAVDRKRAAVNQLYRAIGFAALGDHGLEQVLGGHRAAGKHLGCSTTHGSRQVIHQIDAIDGSLTIGGFVERTNTVLDAAWILRLEGFEPLPIAARPDQRADVFFAPLQQSLDQSRAQKSVRTGHQYLHDLAP